MCIYTRVMKKRMCICSVCVYMCIYKYVSTLTYLRISIDLYVLGTAKAAKAKDLYTWNGTPDIATRSRETNNT